MAESGRSVSRRSSNGSKTVVIELRTNQQDGDQSADQHDGTNSFSSTDTDDNDIADDADIESSSYSITTDKLDRGQQGKDHVNERPHLGLLNDPERVTVLSRTEILGFTESSSLSTDMRFHLMLHFYYAHDAMQFFMNQEEIPGDDVRFLQRTDSAHRFFPFCIFNSVDETPIHWSYQRTGQCVLESMELFATLSTVQFRRYAPFMLNMIVVKLGTDGTYKTGKITLRPHCDRDGVPLMDCSVFRKQMSYYRLRHDKKPINDKEADIFVKTMVRDLTQSAHGNQSAVYTRIYTAIFFETSMREEVREQISRLVPSLAMVVLALLLKEMKLHVATLLAVIVLLFAADQKTMTTIVRVLSAHLLIIAVIAVISRDGQTTFSTTTTWTAAVIISAITGAFVAIEYHQFRRLVDRIHLHFHANGSPVGYFKDIDQII